MVKKNKRKNNKKKEDKKSNKEKQEDVDKCMNDINTDTNEHATSKDNLEKRIKKVEKKIKKLEKRLKTANRYEADIILKQYEALVNSIKDSFYYVSLRKIDNYKRKNNIQEIRSILKLLSVASKYLNGDCVNKISKYGEKLLRLKNNALDNYYRERFTSLLEESIQKSGSAFSEYGHYLRQQVFRRKKYLDQIFEINPKRKEIYDPGYIYSSLNRDAYNFPLVGDVSIENKCHTAQRYSDCEIERMGGDGKSYAELELKRNLEKYQG